MRLMEVRQTPCGQSFSVAQARTLMFLLDLTTDAPLTGDTGGPSTTDMDNTPVDNPVFNAGANLGRYLFYDESLSVNGTNACAPCHQAEFGFSDNRTRSVGFDGAETGRHSMRLTNARFYGVGMFFWTSEPATLEEQVLIPFKDPIEMGMTLDTLVEAVQAQDYYPPLFELAFGDTDLTTDRISLALAQFVRSMVGFGSRYDEGRAQVSSSTVPFPNFTDEENAGREVFMNTPMSPNGAGCAVSHGSETISASGAPQQWPRHQFVRR
jgi:cytochrome c peroxidase